MGDIYLSWLPDVVGGACESVGYDWDVFDDDWLYRSRSSGGYYDLPLCVMWHHTAGADNAWGDANYMCYSADARPIANICIDSKVALVLAGGATNTNGSGINSPMRFSRATVPEDDMNLWAVGIEICNNGVGAPYRKQTLDALFAISNAINSRCGNRPEDVCTHEHYAPDRKIDPATAAACEGWKPRSVNASGSWSVDDLRAECVRRAETKPPPESNLLLISAQGDEMAYITKMDDQYFVGGPVAFRVLADEEQVEYVIKKSWTAHKNAGVQPLADWNTGVPVNSIADVTEVSKGGLDGMGILVG